MNSNLIESRQSAYRTGQSTETALIRVNNDIMMSIDKSKPVVLVLLDLSAAFDTVDHCVLFCRLEKCLVYLVRYLSGFGHIWKKVPKECQFRMLYPMC